MEIKQAGLLSKRSFTEILQDLLVDNNINAKKLAQAIGIDRTTIYEWINHNKYPYVKTLIKICEYLKCSLDYILGRDEVNRYSSFKNKKIDFINEFKRFQSINNVSLYRIVKDSGVTNSLTYDWLHKEVIPSVSSLIKLADYFQCSVDELLGL